MQGDSNEGDRLVSDTRDKTFRFTCPECFVSLKARVTQAGARLTCPSCSATIHVPDAPAPKSIAGQTDRTIDTSAAESAGEYDLHTSGLNTTQAADLITVTCHVCATRTSTDRENLGGEIRCIECGTIVPVAEAPKSPQQMRLPDKIDEARVGEYGVDSTQGSVARHEGITIPFNCRLCGTLLRGSLAEVATELVCPDCGTRTFVPPPKKVDPKAVVGAAAGTDRDEYGVHEPNVASANVIPVVCSLCSSRLMARTDQVGQKIQCPDCGAKTVVSPATRIDTRAVMGVMAETGRTPADDYGVNIPQTLVPPTKATPTEIILACPMCGRKVMAPTSHAGRDVACPDCGTLIPVPIQKPTPPTASPTTPAATPPIQETQREKVVHIGVACPRCGTRIHATDRQVGQKLPCPDCNTPITVPPPKADAPVEERIVSGAEEYAVSAPPEVLAQTPRSARSLPPEPTDDPDYDFLDEVDDPEMRWQLRDRSNELAFLGHPGASSRWFAFSLGGFAVFLMLALSFMIFGLPGSWDPTALAWFAALLSLVVAGAACLAWTALFSVNLLAIVQDTSAGNHVVQNWPEGDWTEQIGECFYVLNSCMVSFIPVTILLQTCPPTRPFAMYLYLTGLWITLPVVMLAMLETGSVFMPISANIATSLLRRPGAWAWFYLRSFGLIALGLAMYIAFWRHFCGPIAMPVLAPMATALAMVYARWLGILGTSVQEVIEEAADTEEVDE